MRYLAIDHGLKRTGLAICDPDELICSPLKVIDKPEKLISEITEVIISYQVDEIVIGLPFNMDGSEGSQAKYVRGFAEKLHKSLPDTKINFYDERLSSFQAEKKLIEAEFTNKKKKKRMDAVAAAEILNGFLESKRQ